jgi:dolichol-phosphate mannosyltransferase
MKLAIAIPTYNEATNMEPLLDELFAVSVTNPNTSFRVLVIDDSSPDGTAEVVRTLAAKYTGGSFNVTVLERRKKNGLGMAYIEGFGELLAQGRYDYILQMDADLSHDPAYISKFIEAANDGADLVVGSRYRPGGSTPDWSWFRRFLSFWANVYTRTVLGRVLSDYTGGFNMYSCELLQKLDFRNVTTRGYGFLIELKYKAAAAAGKIAEVPIVFMDRTNGTSKIPKSTIFRSFWLVLRLKWSRH